MNHIEYLNEHLWPGRIGNFFTVLSFVSALFATVAFYLSTKGGEHETQWKKPARWGFYVHALSVIGVVITLFFILFNHLYEYKYAWDHLNSSMPMEYVFSCMWEGQEGSFLLWTLWHVILGVILMRSAKGWEPWVMTILALVEVFLASMLLGVYFGDFQFGSNPFILNRESAENVGLPWTLRPDYLSLPVFADGRGLNPLLQNYWMTIHPPTLFLGFASTVFPFVYAIAGMWRKDYSGWMKPAIPWAFFGVMILGTGILMGGAWAYEALGFGGFWAWDPVENASLVPWLTFVAAAHLLVINQRKETSVFATLVLTLSTFILVLYSTFLTRSGVLGDSSVHSFVDSGILPQLLVYLLVFVALSTVLLSKSRMMRWSYIGLSALLLVLAVGSVISYDEVAHTHAEGEQHMVGEGTWVPTLSLIFILLSLGYMLMSFFKHFKQNSEQEEALWSREFWMFIGSLVLTLSAIHITVQTSVNVGNIFLAPFEKTFAAWHESTGWDWMRRLSEHNFAAPGDKERFDIYHKIQVPLAFVLFLIIAIGQFLKYKKTDMKQFWKKISLSFFGALVVTLVLGFFTGFSDEQFPIIALMFASIWALFANADYAVRVVKGQIDHIGASIAHLGFAMLIIGAVVSTSQNYFISQNKVGNVSELSKDFNNSEDLMILMGDTLPMGEYFIHYKDKYKDGDHLYCEVEYFSQKPRTYNSGDVVQMQGMVFRCNEKHVASSDFLKDWSVDSLWSPMLVPNEKTEANAQLWRPGTPGEYLFTLTPSVITSKKGNSREPSIKHFVGEDLYTFIKYTEIEPSKTDTTGYLDPESGIIQVGQLVRMDETLNFVLDSLVKVDTIPDDLPKNVSVKRGYVTLSDSKETEKLVLVSVLVNDSTPVPFPTESKKFKALFSLLEKPEGIELTAQQHAKAKRDMLIMTAEVFPQINVLWLGCLVMVIGTTMAIRHRIRLAKNKAKLAD
jgi:cytochrome c-type biogenesis protein CcmF